MIHDLSSWIVTVFKGCTTFQDLQIEHFEAQRFCGYVFASADVW